MRSASSRASAVVDTNLIVSGLVFERGAPRRLVRAGFDQTFSMLISQSVRAEYERVLTRPWFATKYGLSPDDVDAFLKLLDTSASMVTPLTELPVPVRDPKDEPILAAALGGQANYLVTGDKDLLVLAGDPRLGTLRIVKVADFLAAIAVPAES